MNKRLIIKHSFIIAVVIIYYIAVNVTQIYCPIRAFTGYPCPTCGMTRAMLAAFRLDFYSYFKYNPMALPLLLAIFFGIHNNKFINKNAAQYYIIVTAVLTTVLYIFRLIDQY